MNYREYIEAAEGAGFSRCAAHGVIFHSSIGSCPACKAMDRNGEEFERAVSRATALREMDIREQLKVSTQALRDSNDALLRQKELLTKEVEDLEERGRIRIVPVSATPRPWWRFWR